ncbi:MAG: 5'/3'-nucleotidase SurE [Nitrospirae bacterium]|nr:5'/3'-nucleotidase SurE [Nitrospirota bacterium]
MKILLTNDDGINSLGIYALYQELKKIGQVSIVAPETEQSAVGHAITLSNPLRVREIYRDGSFYGYSVNGTPADCVKLGALVIFKEPPDIVVSGINLGPNLGIDIIYSGTVSAATEGTVLGFPSLAISLGTRRDPDYSFAAAFTKGLCLKVKEKGLPPGILLNVNIPAISCAEIKGVKISRQGKSRFKDTFEKRRDPRGNVYYWLTGEIVREEENEEADTKAVDGNYVSITPLHFDLTSYLSIRGLKEWDISLKD